MSDCIKKTVAEYSKEYEGLDSSSLGSGLFGSDWEIDGHGADLVDYKISRAELVTLGINYVRRFFFMVKLSIAGHSYPSQYGEMLFCQSRIETISEVLSPGKAFPAFEEYIAEQSKEADEFKKEFEQSQRELEEANNQP